MIERLESEGPEDFTFEYPMVQRGAQVFVVAGEYTLSKTAEGVQVASIS